MHDYLFSTFICFLHVLNIITFIRPRISSCMDYMTMCCFLSEKALVEQAFELRSELENATSDVSNLFAKIGMWMIFSQV